MPSKTPKQAKFMRAIAHGWTPSRMKSPPSRAVAQEFVDADRKYSGGFAENRYAKGGLSAMGEVDAGSERQRPLQQLGNWQEGGDVDYRVPGEPGVYEAETVEGMGPALEQMFSDMEAERAARNKEVIDYTWDKTEPVVAETRLDEKLEAMSGPEQVEYVKPRLLAAMRQMKTIGESEKFKQYSIKDYWQSHDQVNRWRDKWSKALQQQAREAKGPMPTEEELNRIGVDDAGNPIMMEEEGMQRGGRAGRRGGRRRDGGAGTPTTTNVPTVTAQPSPWGTEAGTTQEMLGRMGYSGPMGYIGVVSGLRQAGWTAAPGSDPDDLRNTMWYPPEDTFTGGGGPGGPGGPPPRIIPTDPASYVGGTPSGTSGGGGGGSSGEGSQYRKDLRQHQRRIENILGSARGGHVNYYEEGGAVRPGHAEGPNPYEGDPLLRKSYARWEKKHHIAPPPPPEVVEAEPEEIPWWKKLMGYEAGPTKTDEALEAMGQAYGGRVGYQAGGLAMAAPAGGVPPWIEPTGSGPGYMDEPPPGYQFGGAASRFRGGRRGRFGGGQRGQPYRGVPPQRGMISRGATGDPNATADRMRGMVGAQRGAMPGGGAQPPGGLAAMYAQAQQQQAGAMPGGGGLADRMRQIQAQAQQAAGGGPDQGGLTPGGPGYDPGGPGTFNAIQERARAAMDEQGGAPGGGSIGLDPYSEGELSRRGPRGPMAPGGGGGPFQLPGGGEQFPDWRQRGTIYDPTADPMAGGKRLPGSRIAPPPGKYPGGSGPYSPGGRDPRSFPAEGGGIQGGPRVPPNMRGYLQKQRMMNRPPSGPVGGGGGNRVGMADQQGALSRAMQRGTGRPPMSRRMAFGRGAQQ